MFLFLKKRKSSIGNRTTVAKKTDQMIIELELDPFDKLGSCV